MEPPSGRISPTSVFTLCDNIIETLERRPTASEDTSDQASVLRNDIYTLRGYFELVDRVRWAQPPHADIGDDFWNKLMVLMNRCRSTMSSLHQLLEKQASKSVEQPSPESTWRRSVELPSQRTIRAHIKLYNKTFRITLHTINL